MNSIEDPNNQNSVKVGADKASQPETSESATPAVDASSVTGQTDVPPSATPLISPPESAVAKAEQASDKELHENATEAAESSKREALIEPVEEKPADIPPSANSTSDSSIPNDPSPQNSFPKITASDPKEAFRQKLASFRFPNGFEQKKYHAEIDLKELLSEYPSVSILSADVTGKDTGFEAKFIEGKIVLAGIPKKKGTLSVKVEYLRASENQEQKKNICEELPALMIYPDPKTLWKNLPHNAEAPYQAADEEASSCFGIHGKSLLTASKRGRAHAHDGKFRDDAFRYSWLKETGWLIVAISDGAGSAEFSRKGAQLACSCFVEELEAKLGAEETNAKINAISDKRKQELALERLLLSTAYQATVKIKTFAEQEKQAVKNYSATFLGYIAQKKSAEWLIVSVGIGDGAIALLDTENTLHLMNKPDGSEYAGQTRFLTTQEIWQDTAGRTFSVRPPDFKFLISMTDGVSDPKFETDNNLRESAKWLELWEDLTVKSDSPVHLDKRDGSLEKELLSWLDFWSKGNHDDRTLTILY